MKLQNNIFEKGYLRTFMADRMNNKILPKLENHDLSRIATILGKISRHMDLYSVLFEQPNEFFAEHNVYTKDLAAFVVLDHAFTRGYICKTAGGKATSDTTNSQGVPLALEGARRIYNKTYMSWLNGLDLTDKDSAIRADIFLPADLGSIDIGPKGPIISKNIGLIQLLHNKISFPLTAIHQIREQVPNYLTTHTPKLIDATVVDGEYGTYYNKCAHKLRAMILQGWIYSPVCRNVDMITNITNWDNYPSATGFEAIKPNFTTVDDKYCNFLNISPITLPKPVAVNDDELTL